eukprot:scaffold4191_cov76-Skeletonema_dohrnii-CCMP3373.AAC.10
MANYHGSLVAVDCHIHSVRYEMVLEELAVIPNWASSGHLRRRSDADTTYKYWRVIALFLFTYFHENKMIEYDEYYTGNIFLPPFVR